MSVGYKDKITYKYGMPSLHKQKMFCLSLWLRQAKLRSNGHYFQTSLLRNFLLEAGLHYLNSSVQMIIKILLYPQAFYNNLF